MTRRKFSTDHLPFRNLAFDTRYNREVMPKKLKELVRNWRLEDVGAITVSIREGKIIVIDGQHRVRAAIELGLGDTKVLCHVYRGLTLEEEARKFLALNDTKKVTAHDRYKAGVVAHDPLCLGVRDTLAHYGLKIGGGSTDGTVRCVGKALTIYERDPKVLDGVCLVLTEAWGTRASAFEAIVFSAVGSVIGRYDGEIDDAALVKKLGAYRGGSTALAGDARGLADYRPISVTRAAAEIIVDTYNKGRRSGALPPM